MPRTRPALRRLPQALLATYAVLGGMAAQAQSAVNTLAPVVVTDRSAPETALTPVYGMVAARSSTGLKTDTSILEAPQSISVVTREQIELQGASGVDEAVRYTSGSVGGQFGSDPRSDWLLVRGFRPTQYLDGLALPDGTWTGYTRLEPYALERIEILKGPASASYGALPPSGFINAVSKRPQADPLREVVLEIGSFEKRQFSLDFSGPLSEDGTLLYRLTGLARDGNGVTSQVKDQRFMLAPSITWNPSTDTSLTLLAQFQHANTALGGGLFLPAKGTLYANPNGPIARDAFSGEPGYDKYEKDYVGIGYQFSHKLFGSTTFRQNLRFNDAKVDNPTVSGLGFVAGSDRLLSRYVYTPREKSKMFNIDNQLETTVQQGDVGHTLLAGVDFKRSHNDYRSGFGFGVGTLDIYNPVYGSAVTEPADSTHNVQTQKQLGLYAQDQLRWGPWVATISGRHDTVHTDTDNQIAHTSQSQSDAHFSGRVGVNYVTDSGFSPYVAYANSFQPNTGTTLAGSNFKPTTARQFEAGIKYRPQDGRALFTAAVFDLRQRDVRVDDPVALAAGKFGYQVQQGEIQSKGLELEGRFSAARNLDMVSSLTLTNAKVTATTSASDLGKQVTQQPKTQASLWADYRFPRDVAPGVGIGGGLRYVGASYGDSANTIRTPGYTLLDMQAHYDVDQWRFLLTVSNLANKQYVSTCSSTSWCYYGYGRTANLSARYVW